MNLSTVSVLRVDCAFWSQLSFAEPLFFDAERIAGTNHIVLFSDHQLVAVVLEDEIAPLLLRAHHTKTEVLHAVCQRTQTHILKDWEGVVHL